MVVLSYVGEAKDCFKKEKCFVMLDTVYCI